LKVGGVLGKLAKKKEKNEGTGWHHPSRKMPKLKNTKRGKENAAKKEKKTQNKTQFRAVTLGGTGKSSTLQI